MCCNTKQTFRKEISLVLLNDIKKHRKRKGVTQEEMSKSIGISRSSLSRIETSSYSPSAKTMHKISDYLNVPIGEIFFNPNVSKNSTKNLESEENSTRKEGE